MKQISKEAAGYLDPRDRPKDVPHDRFCRTCTMFHYPGSCDLVRGTIHPAGWCKHWTNAPKGET